MDALDHPLLPDALQSIETHPDDWSPDLSLRAVSILFPHRMSVETLCSVLTRMPHNERLVNDLQWRITRLVADSPMSLSSMERLRDDLVALILVGLRWEDDYPHLRSDNPHLTGILAALCLRGLAVSRSVKWLRAAFVSLRLQDKQLGPEQPQRELHKLLTTLDAKATAALFWAAHDLFRPLREFSDPWHHLLEILAHERYVELRADRDLGWIKDSLSDVSRDVRERNLMLAAAIRLPPAENVGTAHLEGLLPLIADSADLSEALNQFMARVSEAAVLERWNEEDNERRLARERQHAKHKESWIRLAKRVANDPDYAFSDAQAFSTVHALWRQMRTADSEDRVSGWNRLFIEQYFKPEIVAHLRDSLIAVWRNHLPPLPYERPESERNSYLDVWLIGLAGIFAEAEDPNWATHLSDEDARRAARYSLTYITGLPRWMESVSAHHPEAVDATIGAQLAWDLEQPTEHHDITLLYHLAHGAETTARVVLPRFLKWLRDEGDLRPDQIYPGRHLTRILDVILMAGGDGELAIIEQLAVDRLASELPVSVAAAWLHTLTRLNPEAGIRTLEDRLSKTPPAKTGPGVDLINALFGDRSNAINPRTLAVSPPTLLRLARLAHHHVRPEDDQRHDGAYTPNDRDDAQRARETILGAILERKGSDAWAVKLELANDPITGDYKDRVIALAEEAWANEVDETAFTEAQAAAFDKNDEAPPMTDEGMFLVMADRLDTIEDLLLQDISPRELWADIEDEHVMRREIARVLDGSKRDIYRINQEAVTADEKETDIRLVSTASDHQAVIELKIGENGYSGRVLRDTITDQLVQKYMAPQGSRSGCLLVTVAKDRNWDHPETGKKIDIDGLREMLSTEANRVATAMGGSVRLKVVVLDLRKRLGTEAERRSKQNKGP